MCILFKEGEIAFQRKRERKKEREREVVWPCTSSVTRVLTGWEINRVWYLWKQQRQQPNRLRDKVKSKSYSCRCNLTRDLNKALTIRQHRKDTKTQKQASNSSSRGRQTEREKQAGEGNERGMDGNRGVNDGNGSCATHHWTRPAV